LPERALRRALLASQTTFFAAWMAMQIRSDHQKTAEVRMLKLAFVAFSAALAVSATTVARAEFPEKNIEFVIPFGTGGGFDRAVRLISPYLEKALPKKVDVVPKNVPGAGGRKGTAQVYRAKPDGYSIVIANVPGIALPGLTGEKIEYDFGKFTWIVKIGESAYVAGVSAKGPHKSMDDLKKLGRPVKCTSTGFGATAYAACQIIAKEMGFPVQMLAGYKGSAEYVLAVVRGDGDFTLAPVIVMKKFIQAGDIRGVFTTEANSSLPGVPTVASLGHNSLTGLGVDRYALGPPGIPAPVAKTLSDSLVKAMNDPELKAKAEKTGEPFTPLGIDKAKAAADRSLALYLKYKAEIGKR
jgi:tripartite-type tricarboxylate transporter receptor subunit TctC